MKFGNVILVHHGERTDGYDPIHPPQGMKKLIEQSFDVLFSILEERFGSNLKARFFLSGTGMRFTHMWKWGLQPRFPNVPCFTNKLLGGNESHVKDSDNPEGEGWYHINEDMITPEESYLALRGCGTESAYWHLFKDLYQRSCQRSRARGFDKGVVIGCTGKEWIQALGGEAKAGAVYEANLHTKTLFLIPTTGSDQIIIP